MQHEPAANEENSPDTQTSNSKEFDQRLMSEKSEARENTTKLAREVGRYEQELGDLNMFISRKTELENELEDTKMELLKERKKHEQIITDLERKTTQEKDRLRKEMEARIRMAKDKFMEDTEGQLEQSTKETMHHNEQMASELAYQHRETERLVHKNRRLTEENLATRRELELYRHAEAELSKRNHAYLVTIQSLLSKLRALEGASAELSKPRATSGDYVTSAYKNKVNVLQQSVEDTLSMLDSMRSDLESKKGEVERVRMQREELGFLVLQAAQEAKGHLTDSIYGQTIQEDEESVDDTRERRQAGPQFAQHVRLDELKGAQRHQVLRYIFERVSDLHNVARKNIMPDDSADGGGNVMFPKIDRTRLGTQSLRGDGGSLDSERRRIKTGADHRSEGGVSR
jgi:hypothetical protein